jgi:hypothetical protein
MRDESERLNPEGCWAGDRMPCTMPAFPALGGCGAGHLSAPGMAATATATACFLNSLRVGWLAGWLALAISDSAASPSVPGSRTARQLFRNRIRSCDFSVPRSHPHSRSLPIKPDTRGRWKLHRNFTLPDTDSLSSPRSQVKGKNGIGCGAASVKSA